MYKYLIKRLVLLIPVLVGVTFIVFFIMDLAPSNPGQMILGINADPEKVEAVNEELGYNKPFFIRFFNYIKDIVTKFDFGNSYVDSQPVLDTIMVKFPYTLKLAIGSVFVSTILGLILGVTAAVKHYSFVDNSITVFAMIVAVMPSFWAGMLFILLFSITLRWLPASGASSYYHYILPILTIGLSGAGKMMRLTRSVVLETLYQDYITTARAKGVPERIVIYKHALKNAMLPLVTQIGTQFAFMLGGAVLAETVFNIPGIGLFILTSIRSKDIPAVMTCTLFFAFLFSIIMLLMDLLYGFIDPRIKAKYSRG